MVPLEGRVDTCPRCGRNGVLEYSDYGNPYFVHRQTSEVLCDGMLTQPEDYCPLAAMSAA
jgi:ssDNA-binding Zn-finger/Zn-ribbon topoisomerase 1